MRAVLRFLASAGSRELNPVEDQCGAQGAAIDPGVIAHLDELTEQAEQVARDVHLAHRRTDLTTLDEVTAEPE